MSGEGKLLEEFAQMVNLRIDELNKLGYGATERFREARKINDEIQQLILQQKPEIDEAWMEEKALELNNEILLESHRGNYFDMAKRFITQIIRDAQGVEIKK